MKRVTIDYLKYCIYDTYALLEGYDQRKKEVGVIRIPSKIYYDGHYYPVEGLTSTPDGRLKTSIIEVPNTMSRLGPSVEELIEHTGEEHTFLGLTVRVYEAREGYKAPEKKVNGLMKGKQESLPKIIKNFLSYFKKLFKKNPTKGESVDDLGILPGVFTFSNGRKIRFSKGNLQFHPLNNAFRFAERQYETLGKEANEKCSPTLDGWIDIFCWATSGYMGHSPATVDQATLKSYRNRPLKDLTGSYSNYDWGVFNPITNGGNKEGLWRTPLAEEWDYLVKERPNAERLKFTCTLCGKKGFVLLPDDFWSNDNDLNFTINIPSSNQFGLEQWNQLELLGAVFFPESEVIRLNVLFDENVKPYWRPSWGTDINFFTASEELPRADKYGAGKGVYGEKLLVRLIQDVK